MPAPAIAETREELRPFHRHSWTADRILIRTAIKQEIGGNVQNVGKL